MDERQTFGQFIGDIFGDFGGFVFGMMLSFFILMMAYGLLRFALEPFFKEWVSN